MVLLHVVFGGAKLMEKNGMLDTFIQSLPGWMNWTWQVQGSDPLFILCGVLVSYTLFREMDKTHRIDLKRYALRRFLRIYPVFLLAILIYLPSDEDFIGYLIPNLFFVSNFMDSARPIIPVGWSLEVQIQFYLILPIIFFLLYATRWRISFLVFLVLASFAYRYWVIVSDPSLYQYPFYQIIYDSDYAHLVAGKLHYDFDARMANFFLGILVAELHYYHGKKIQAFLKEHYLFNTLLFALACYMITWSIGSPILDKTSDYFKDFTTDTTFWYLVAARYVYCLAISIILIQILCPAGIGRFVEKFFALPIWHPFAQLIFPIYLFHFPLIVIGAVVTFGTIDVASIGLITPLQIFIIFFWSVVFTVIFSTAVHLFFEKPFIVMREKAWKTKS
jgi:peptidoglycan/LPS O-acetylase OafA/YrhL